MQSSELVGRVMKGEADFAVVVVRFRQQVRRWLYAVLGPGSDLEELSQCVFIRAYSRLDRYDPVKGSFGAWLHTIAHNVAVSALRQRNRAPESLDALPEAEAPSCAGPEELYQARARRERLRELIGALKPRERQAFIGHHLRGLTWPEVAAGMGCCEHSARNWAALAVEKLRKEL